MLSLSCIHFMASSKYLSNGIMNNTIKLHFGIQDMRRPTYVLGICLLCPEGTEYDTSISCLHIHMVLPSPSRGPLRYLNWVSVCV
jgi:hypothetical protein